MIFGVAGTQLGFPRLMRYFEALAVELDEQVVVQTAQPGYAPAMFTARAFMPPGEFDAHVRGASVVVGHAGIGTILAARRFARPLVIVNPSITVLS